MDHSPRRIIDEARLAGLWLRRAPSGSVLYAPAGLPDDTWALVQAELRPAPGALATEGRPSRRMIHRWLFDRGGQRDGGEVDRPAVTFGQALASVEREPTGLGVRFAAAPGT
jgi:hypothetical protein